MRIKKIEIVGFKSFCDRTVLQFDEPITGVVGPNGCGKSNVVDAIRWCMGEQSAKHLRGKSMEDVIFNGSDSRGPASMAEVSLTFENVALNQTVSNDVEMDEEIPEIDLEAAPEGESAEGVEAESAEGVTPESPESIEAAPVAEELSFEIPRIAAEPDVAVAEAPPPIDLTSYGSITVTRRLYRDGTSEYELNKAPARLRDITDFFLGTGVGTKAYSIIEQGRVGMIVSAKPDERRLVIEEAAGITKFKKKKQAAERKMDQTRQNLLRVTDVVAEIEKQLASLRRQAQKAERYKKYRAEVRDIEMWSAAHRTLGILAETQIVRASLDDAAGQRQAAAHDLDVKEAHIAAERAEIAVEDRRLSEETQALYDLENRIQLGERQIEFSRKEAAGLTERATQARSEIETLRVQVIEAERERDAAADAVRASVGAHDACAGEVAGLEERLRIARANLADAEAELDDARRSASKAAQDIAGGEQTQRALERRQGELEARLGRVAEEEGRLDARRMELADAIGKLDETLGGLRQTTLDLGSQKTSLEAQKGKLEETVAQGAMEVETLRTELHRRRSRLQSLQEIQQRYEGFARGTRSIMQHKPDDVRGLVADIVEAPSEIEPAVEAVLGDRLSSILVESQAVGLEAIDFLKRRSEGRSTFIPVAGLEVSRDAGGIEVVEAAGVRGPLLSMVKCKAPYADVGEVLFKDVLVVESLQRALELWESGVKRTFVTIDGDLVDKHGVVTGGSRDAAGAGVLTQKREIRELEEISHGLDGDLADAQARHVAAKTELQKVTATLDAIRKDAHQGELAMVTHEKDLSRWKAEAERAAERGGQLARERGELETGLAEASREREETAAKLAAARAGIEDAERRQAGLAEGVTVGKHAVEDAATEATEVRVKLARLAAERQAHATQAERLGERAGELEDRIERLGRSIEDGGTKADQLVAEAAALEDELTSHRSERTRRADELAAAKTAHEARTGALGELEVATRALRQDAEKLGAEATRAEMKLAALETDRRHLAETIAERYRVDLNKELHAYHLRAPIGEAEEAKLRELRDLIERMGEINLTAIEEFDEASKRYDFLTTQRKDLEDALATLEKAIAKINKTSRKLFRETFELVNAKFMEVFPRLFRGGQASLRLVGGDDDVLDAGVEIMAQPPGKKNTTVELLSGGEKALTAVSLIFAIFLIKPSPFCLLDEVDAPLDEANVGRYNELVREMTDRSQFIVITHNKRTMQIADALYGVTMEEPGCSKLVNVNLRKLDTLKAA